jgi:hypothetical protein
VPGCVILPTAWGDLEARPQDAGSGDGIRHRILNESAHW